MNNATQSKDLLAQIQALIDAPKEKTITITKNISFELKPYDEPEHMTWYEAMEKFGPYGTDKEWRLPTRIELLSTYEQKDAICGLNLDECYWLSTESNYSFAWYQRFSDGYQYYYSKNNNYLVRCARR